MNLFQSEFIEQICTEYLPCVRHCSFYQLCFVQLKTAVPHELLYEHVRSDEIAGLLLPGRGSLGINYKGRS